MGYTFNNADVMDQEFLLRLYLATILETILQISLLPWK